MANHQGIKVMIEQLNSKIATMLKGRQNRAKEGNVNTTSDNEMWSKTAALKDLPSGNNQIKKKQQSLFILLLVAILAVLLVIISFMQEERQQKIVNNEEQTIKVAVASEAIDPEKMWRNHFEDKLYQSQLKFDERMQQAEEERTEQDQKLITVMKDDMIKMQEQLKFAHQELASAAVELKRVRELQENTNQPLDIESEPNITAINLQGDLEFDQPKSSRIFIPETSYVTGYLLRGLVLSTALNAPENPTPVIIKLTERGNLPKNFMVDISTCSLQGSAYGDLSSERASIRLEKLVCIDPQQEMVTITDIVGDVSGPDGANGIKGDVVATSSKHIKNAMLGGLISGLVANSKGQDATTITAFGAIDAKRKSFSQLAGQGVLNGTSNGVEKVADYYLKMAENMSPVLTIPGGVRVQAVIQEGVFFGQRGMPKKVAKLRRQNQIQQEQREE